MFDAKSCTLLLLPAIVFETGYNMRTKGIFFKNKDYNDAESSVETKYIIDVAIRVVFYACFHASVRSGRRGGYMQIMGFDKDTYKEFVKLWSINLCSNLDGQIAVDVMVNPPKPGEPSYPLFRFRTSSLLISSHRP